MSTEVRWRRGTDAQHAAFIGAMSEITHDTTNNNLRVHDGVTEGGHATLMAREKGAAGGIATLDENGLVPESQLGNVSVPDKSDYGSITAVETAEIKEDVQYLRTAGYYTPGDGGGALYKRVATEPSHAGKVQSADGAWWEIADKLISSAQFGVAHSGARLGSPVSHALSPAFVDQHFGVEYSSSSSDGIHYGYTANIIRTGGDTLAVGAQLNAFHKNTDSNTAAIWGAALEAWTGDHNTAPSSGAILIGIEPAIIQQRHDSDFSKIGVDIVFKNRKDGGSLLHGSVGANKYNKSAKAIQISSQSRTPLDEFCGWKTGISFEPDSLDMDIDGGAIGIDLIGVDVNRLDYGVRLGQGHAIGWQENSRKIKMRWLSSVDRIQILDGEFERIGFDTSSGGLFINGAKVVGERQPLIPTPSPDGTSLKLAVDQIRDLLVQHGLMASA